MEEQKEEDIYEKKQVRYASFNSRLIASIIDLFLIILILFPLIRLIESYLYGTNTPMAFLQPILQEAFEKFPTNEEAGKRFEFLIHDPRIYEYFVTNHGIKKIIIDNIIQIAIFMSVILTCWFYTASSPGKMMLSLKLADEKTLGKPTKWQLIVRFFGYIVSSLPFFLGFFWSAFSKKKQAWHDKMSGIVVIKR